MGATCHSFFLAAHRLIDFVAVDEHFTAPDDVKRKLTGCHGNTNYSVVDIDLIDDLYRHAYQEKVLGTERLRFLNVSRLTGVEEVGDKVRATVRSLVSRAALSTPTASPRPRSPAPRSGSARSWARSSTAVRSPPEANPGRSPTASARSAEDSRPRTVPGTVHRHLPKE